jgi:tRNA isopentenyl-2-thiomethyl-A-37 hydroxylase MiaE
LYYKLRSSELYEDAKALAMTLSSVVSAPEHMAQRCGFSDGNMAEYLSRLRSTARHYMDKYVLASRREEAPEVSDAEVLRSIEETLEKYKRLLLRSSVGG